MSQTSSMRVKSYGRLEQEVQALEDQVKFYQTELEGTVKAERQRAVQIIRRAFGENSDVRWAISEILETEYDG